VIAILLDLFCAICGFVKANDHVPMLCVDDVRNDPSAGGCTRSGGVDGENIGQSESCYL